MRRLSGLVVLLLALILALSACGDSTPTVAPATPAGATTQAAATTQASATTQAAATTQAVSVGEVPAAKSSGLSGKVSWWHISTVEPAKSVWQAMANAYMKANPGVTIEITVIENEAFKSKMTTAMQAGTPPDLFQSWGGGVLQEYARAGLVKDITPDLKGGWGDTFNKAPLDVYAFDGKNYGVPWDMGAVGFWYNKAAFQKAGITGTPKTWTEFKDAVTKLKAAGFTPLTVGAKDKWPIHFYWVYLATRLGGKAAFEKAYNRTGSFADPSFVEAGKKFQELLTLEAFGKDSLALAYLDQEKMMVSGKVGMELMGQWTVATQKDSSDNKQGLGNDLGFFPFPMVEGGAGDKTDVMGGGNGIAVGKNASPAAIDFLKYLSSVESQRVLAAKGLALPVVKGAEDAISDPNLRDVQAMVRDAKYFQLYYDQYLPPAVGGIVNDNVQALFAGTINAEAMAKAVEESAASEIKKK